MFLDVVKNRGRAAAGLILVVLLLAVIAWVGTVFGWGWAGLLLLALLGWCAAVFSWTASRRQERQVHARDLAALHAQMAEAERRHADDERRMQAVFALNRALVNAADERALMDEALPILTDFVGALGCSFVPVDEWQQPLPPFTFGQLPAPVLSAWSSHLASSLLRERCGTCQVLESTPGACPLHPEQLGNSLAVFCLPLSRAGSGNAALQAEVKNPHTQRTTGVLHLYLPAGKTLDAETRQFLDGMLSEIALGYEATRLRGQEQTTLRQLQMLHSSEADFTASLGGLLDGLTQALGVDFAMIRLRPSADGRLSNLNVQRGEWKEQLDEMEPSINDALTRVQLGKQAASENGQVPVWLALPLELPENGLSGEGSQACEVLGMLLVGANHPHEFHPRQLAIIQTIAAQAALLAENERLIRSMEYKVVIQERARLAREIHDGLAQTLAFLKLQAAQMQSYLAQGDMTRLSQILKDNYQILAEAYLDTRQAIDNLRTTPQDGLESWLDRILSEFASVTGMRVERNIQPLERKISPEVQAHLIRILQEALSNVRKHARARVVRVSLFEWSGDLILEVSDDGQGFAAEDVPEISRHGLRGMRERAEMIGADFQIISQVRQGTTVHLALPAWFEEETP